MIDLNEINDFLSEGYCIEKQQGKYFLREASTGEIPIYYEERDIADKSELLKKLNEAIINHEELKSQPGLNSSRKYSDNKKIQYRIQAKAL